MSTNHTQTRIVCFFNKRYARHCSHVILCKFDVRYFRTSLESNQSNFVLKSKCYVLKFCTIFCAFENGISIQNFLKKQFKSINIQKPY